jgi:GT2 family glycosyltransferase
MRNVSIVIPNWNGRELLPEFLPSVFAAAARYSERHGAEAEVIIVDDASTDASLRWLKENCVGRALVIERAENGGFVRAVNDGFAAARHPIVLLLNNDVCVEPDAIAPLVKHFDDEEVFAVCSKAYRLGTDLLDGAGKLGRFERGFWRVFLNYDVLPTRLPAGGGPFYSFFGSGGYTAYDRAKFAELGGFCGLLAPIYWEDVELSYRAWRRGWQVRYEPASVVHHKSSATMGKPSLRRPMKVITERNRLLMTWVNLHDGRWLFSHLTWLALKLAGATLSLNRAYWQSFLQAASRLGAVRQARARAKQSSARTDRELAAIFKRLEASDWVDVIRNEADYRRYVELRRRLENEAAM